MLAAAALLRPGAAGAPLPTQQPNVHTRVTSWGAKDRQLSNSDDDYHFHYVNPGHGFCCRNGAPDYVADYRHRHINTDVDEHHSHV